jgi:hypothetical protein
MKNETTKHTKFRNFGIHKELIAKSHSVNFANQLCELCSKKFAN